jgi:hypothetical protein
MPSRDHLDHLDVPRAAVDGQVEEHERHRGHRARRAPVRGSERGRFARAREYRREHHGQGDPQEAAGRRARQEHEQGGRGGRREQRVSPAERGRATDDREHHEPEVERSLTPHAGRQAGPPHEAGDEIRHAQDGGGGLRAPLSASQTARLELGGHDQRQTEHEQYEGARPLPAERDDEAEEAEEHGHGQDAEPEDEHAEHGRKPGAVVRVRGLDRPSRGVVDGACAVPGGRRLPHLEVAVGLRDLAPHARSRNA